MSEELQLSIWHHPHSVKIAIASTTPWEERGDQDGRCVASAAYRLAADLHDAGLDSVVVTIVGGGHAEIRIDVDPGEDRQPTIKVVGHVIDGAGYES